MSAAADASEALAALAADLRAEESVISDYVGEAPGTGALGLLVAAGPRTAGDGAAYATVIECVREGYLLHYGDARLIKPPDQDLALLAGDYLYAKGLERLAALGDPFAVRELSDLISLSAQLHASGDGADPAAAAALWLASSVAVAVGPSEAHEDAKRSLVDRGSGQGLYAAAAEAAAEAGLDEQLAEAAEAVGFPPSHRG
jgi:hypothetical protein